MVVVVVVVVEETEIMYFTAKIKVLYILLTPKRATFSLCYSR